MEADNCVMYAYMCEKSHSASTVEVILTEFTGRCPTSHLHIGIVIVVIIKGHKYSLYGFCFTANKT